MSRHVEPERTTDTGLLTHPGLKMELNVVTTSMSMETLVLQTHPWMNASDPDLSGMASELILELSSVVVPHNSDFVRGQR